MLYPVQHYVRTDSIFRHEYRPRPSSRDFHASFLSFRRDIASTSHFKHQYYYLISIQKNITISKNNKVDLDLKNMRVARNIHFHTGAQTEHANLTEEKS